MESDWRLQGQEDYLFGRTFQIGEFKSHPAIKLKENKLYPATWDHEHCEFCNTKFSLSPDDLSRGYMTLDGQYWVCEDCFKDFSGAFHFRMFSNSMFHDRSFVEILRQEIACGNDTPGLYGISRIIALSNTLKDSLFIQSKFVAKPYAVDVMPKRAKAICIPTIKQVVEAGYRTNQDYCNRVNELLTAISKNKIIQESLHCLKENMEMAIPILYFKIDEYI